MAQWDTYAEHQASEFNNGNKYTENDQLALNEVNNAVENSLSAMRIAKNAQATTENGISYNPQSATKQEKVIAKNNIGAESPNLFDYTKILSGNNNGVLVTNNNDGSFSVTDNRTGAVFGGIYYTTVLPAGTYYVSGGDPYTGAFFEVIYEVGGQNVYKINTTFTLTQDTSCTFYVALNPDSYIGGQQPTWTVSPMVNIGGSALPFEPYTGAIQHSINNSYSYNEIDTGTTWVNGKKIYKKTFYIASKTITGSGSEIIAPINISGATNCINCELCGKLVSGSTSNPFIGMTGITNTVFEFDGFSSGEGGNLKSRNNSGTGETFTDIYFTVYYTK